MFNKVLQKRFGGLPVLIVALITILAGSGEGLGQAKLSPTAPVQSEIGASQSSGSQGRQAGNSPLTVTDPKANSDSDRINALEQELRAQKEKIDRLYQVILDQQQKINNLSAAVPSGPASQMPAVTAAIDPHIPSPQTTAVAASSSTDGRAGQTPQQTLEDRVKKVETQVLKIGPFRFSGDFRLRFDGIFRRSEPDAPVGFAQVPLVQNARLRYRFRFNIDTDMNEKVSFHAQLATGPANNPLTNDQDFTSTVARHPFLINEAWIDYHPNKSVQLQGGRVLEIFADNSRFLFDDDVRFNGFNEKFVLPFKTSPGGIESIEFRAGQYIFSNPNVAVVTPGSPLAMTGAEAGTIGRSSNLFHQGVLVNHAINKKWTQQFGGDVQLYRNPDQIQLASTAAGATLIVYPGLGITLSGPLTGTGNATTTPGGSMYTAPNFQIGRFTYRLNYSGFESGGHNYPVVFNAQFARNMGTGLPERDAFLAALQIGKITKRGDMAFTYIYSQKGANALISQLTDDDLGTNSGVNIRTNHFRFDYGLSKKIAFQSLFFFQKELRSSGDFPNFFVPLNAFTPTQFRVQEQIVFTF